jgi:hypothetical protein
LILHHLAFVSHLFEMTISVAKANIWQQVLEHLQADADKQGNLEWGVHYVDGTVIRAHQHAAGGKKGANHRRN